LDNGIAVGRVIALPGETVEVRDGRLAVGGNSVPEPYVVAPMTYTIPPTVLGPDCYYVLGDNRNAAYDSHDFGPVRQAQIVGVQSPCC
jgi:signal peptidase I